MPKRTIKPSELFHIWKTEPCEAGDTLSGGSNVKDLLHLGYIETTQSGYVTTKEGKRYVQRLIEFLDKTNTNLV